MRLVSMLLAGTSLVAPTAFVNTNAGGTLWICSTPQQNDLAQADYEGLSWTQIKAVGSHGETGVSTNILSYNTWDTVVVQKAKGITDAGSPEIELARIPNDAGQILLRAAAKTNLNYAFKIVRNDPTVIGGTPTTIYNRGLVVGPKRPNGRNEDFDLEMFTLGLNQVEIVVNPSLPGNAPVLTAIPTITGTPKVGTTLNATTGTFTGDATIVYAYTWYAGGGVAGGINGGNAYTPVAADIGKVMTVRVTATNAAGSAHGDSVATAVVAA